MPSLNLLRLCQRAVPLVVIAALVAASGPARAQVPADVPAGDSSAAFDTEIRFALAAYAREDWSEAERHFRAAHALQPSAQTLRGLAVVAWRQGLLVQGRRLLVQALASDRQPLAGELRSAAESLLLEIEGQLGRYVVAAEPGEATITVDDRDAAAHEPLWLAAGEHKLVVALEGHVDHTVTLTVTTGARETLRISLQPTPVVPAVESPPEPVVRVQPTPPAGPALSAAPRRRWLGIGIASAGVLVGSAAVWTTALLRQRRIDERCTREPAGGCTDAQVREHFRNDRVNGLAWTARISAVMGTVGLVTAVTMGARRAERSPARLEVGVGPGRVGASLHF